MTTPDTTVRPAGTDLGNWRTTPYSQWAFQNVRELVPSAGIPCSRNAAPLQQSLLPLPPSLALSDGSTCDLQEFLANSETDSLLVSRSGKVVGQWVAPYCDLNRPHIVFSISKSITAMLAGILSDQGIIGVDQVVSHYLPGCKGSAYEDATLRHLLDMNVALDFAEDYLNPDGDYFRYRNATCWNPVDQTGDVETLESFLYSLQKADFQHGEVFNYKSPNTDLLGLVLERSAGIRYADLLSECLWQPMAAAFDAYVTVDRGLLARGAGGICTVAEDLLRFGQLVMTGGAIDSRQVIPESWIMDTRISGNQQAWLRGNFVDLLPTGCYRNQWYQVRDDDGCFFGLGIHGQWLFINPETEVVITRLASQTLPLDDATDKTMLEMLRSLSRSYPG